MDLLRPRFIASDGVSDQNPPSPMPKAYPEMIRRRSADPEMLEHIPPILFEESPSRSSSRRNSITSIVPVSRVQTVAETMNESPTEPCLLRSILQTITSTEMAYIALQRINATQKPEVNRQGKSGRHRVIQPSREFGNKRALTPDQHLGEQLASLRRQLSMLQDDRDRQNEHIRSQCELYESQRSRAHSMVKQLQTDLECLLKELNRDKLLQILKNTKIIETILTSPVDDLISSEPIRAANKR